MVARMIARAVMIAALVGGLGPIAPVAPLTLHAETILFKDNAIITGRVLATKKDLLVVDLGFTAITVPRNAVVKVTDSDAPAASATSGHAPTRAKPEKDKG